MKLEDNPVIATETEELLPVVDENDTEVAIEKRSIIHRDNLLHRAVHIVIMRSDGRILIQQRSQHKDTHPGCWECVGGHLAPGERYRDAALREVTEELGLTINRLEFLFKHAACAETGYEFIEVYHALTDDIVKPNPAEIDRVETITPADLSNLVRSGERSFTPSFLCTLRLLGILDTKIVKNH